MKLRWWHRVSRAWPSLGKLVGSSAATQPAQPRSEDDRADVERRLDYTFVRPELLWTVLSHPSAAVGADLHYERLEFLGDAVLDLAIADLLMRRLTEAKEGVLSKERASIVNGRTLAAKAQEIGVGRALRLGKGEEKSGGRDKVSILAASFEAVIGAIYIDSGLRPAQEVIEALFADDIGGPRTERDYKPELPDIAYRPFRSPPVNVLVSSRGPYHAMMFTTRFRLAGRAIG